MPRTDISNTDAFIDSRDIIARIAELEDTIAAEEVSEDNGAEARTDDEGKTIEDMTTCGTCGKTWNNALVSKMTPAPSARCPYEYVHDEITELAALTALEDEASGYASDWRYGATLIRDSYFQTYAQELAGDLGFIDADAKWPNDCIDWERAARELQQDYTSVEYDGVTYWVR